MPSFRESSSTGGILPLLVIRYLFAYTGSTLGSGNFQFSILFSEGLHGIHR